MIYSGPIYVRIVAYLVVISTIDWVMASCSPALAAGAWAIAGNPLGRDDFVHPRENRSLGTTVIGNAAAQWMWVELSR